MFRKNEAAGEEWSPENVQMCAERQREILEYAYQMLRPGGRLYFEIHENFADETFRMLTREGFPDTAVRRDLNDKNRMTCSLQRR